MAVKSWICSSRNQEKHDGEVFYRENGSMYGNICIAPHFVIIIIIIIIIITSLYSSDKNTYQMLQ